MSYSFKSDRLGFRNWKLTDIDLFFKICSDVEVMEFFPKTLTRGETLDFISRMQQSYSENGYCYFAVDVLESREFIGFIGLSKQSFKNEFTPFIDIGWRLKKSAWNKGFATEGAQRCLLFGFERLNLDCIYAIAPEMNTKSQHLMEKIGMELISSFLHPNIADNHPLQKCVLYKITNSVD